MSNQDFQDRIARLNAKHGQPSQPAAAAPPQGPSDPSRSNMGGGNGGGGKGIWIFGALALIAMPIGAFYATMAVERHVAAQNDAKITARIVDSEKPSVPSE